MTTHLTPAEREAVGYRIEGKPFHEIAKLRRCAIATVLCLSSNACRKLAIRKSTNPATLRRALARFDSKSMELEPIENGALSRNPADY